MREQHPEHESRDGGNNTEQVGGLPGIQEHDAERGEPQEAHAATPQWPGEGACREKRSRDRGERVEDDHLLNPHRPDLASEQPRSLEQHADPRPSVGGDDERKQRAPPAHQPLGRADKYDECRDCEEQFEGARREENRGDGRQVVMSIEEGVETRPQLRPQCQSRPTQQ